jgi:murein DD-endopeptidase MepM/ murein hydrolase activator NlpD
MSRYFIFIIGACALLLTSCMQQPAQVVYKGNEFYGKGNDGLTSAQPRSYISSTSWNGGNALMEQDHYATTATVAPVSSIGVSDLKPIRSNNLPQPSSSFRPAPLPEMKRGDEHGSTAPAASSFKLSLGEQKPVPSRLGSSDQAASFIWPVNGPVIQRFGKKDSGVFNDGINIAADEGEPIWAAADGQVIYAGNALKGYGNMAIIRHKDNWITSYAHASRLSVKKGDTVKQGELVGYVGASGSVTKPQLQFSVRKDKTPVNPEVYLSRSDVASR